MLASELSSTPYNKAAHRRALLPKLRGRSEASIEFKHANISAALLDAGLPYIIGYKPRSNYQALLLDVITERLSPDSALLHIAEADADLPIAVPEVDDILSVLIERPVLSERPERLVSEPAAASIRLPTNYIEREARNRALGNAGELFVINFERARLIHAGKEALAARIEHTSKERGDHEGYDVLSFDADGAPRLIEVKTTKYGGETPFFISRNEVAVSEREAERYQLYRLYSFRREPRLFTLPGAISANCLLTASSFMAQPR
ncbi:MAG TPA: hypothetical protein DEH78_26395 [Solibacterales bacterium]|nr:hypothetical protein [Bryobacterales bacterium]